jgi:hypothetical protein
MTGGLTGARLSLERSNRPPPEEQLQRLIVAMLWRIRFGAEICARSVSRVAPAPQNFHRTGSKEAFNLGWRPCSPSVV